MVPEVSAYDLLPLTLSWPILFALRYSWAGQWAVGGGGCSDSFPVSVVEAGKGERTWE